MKKILPILAMVIGFLMSGCAHDQSSRPQTLGDKYPELKRQVDCLKLALDCSRAENARDWPNLVTTSALFIQSCREFYSQEDISDAYINIAKAFIKMNRPNDALAAANSCSSTYYPNPDCHRYKTVALVQLNRTEEAKNSLNDAETTTKYGLSTIDSYIIAARDPKEKELYKLKKSNYMKKLQFIESYRKETFP